MIEITHYRHANNSSLKGRPNERALNADINTNRVLLGIGNLKQADRAPLDHAGDQVRELFGGRNQVLIFPHAAGNWDASANMAEEALKRFGVKTVVHAHTLPIDRLAEIAQDAQGAIINGGNTWEGSFQMHAHQYQGIPKLDIGSIIRRLVANGAPLTGWSAGPMLFADQVGTCKDPQVIINSQLGPVVPSQGLELLSVGLNIDPHHNKANADWLQQEWMPANQGRIVLAIENGAGFLVRGNRMAFFGEANGAIFTPNAEPQTIRPGDDISRLLA